MQLKDLVKPLGQMSDEELLDHLRQVRHRRTVERPATKARVERAEKKESRSTLTAMEKILATLTPEDKAKLLAQLEESKDGKAGNI